MRSNSRVFKSCVLKSGCVLKCVSMVRVCSSVSSLKVLRVSPNLPKCPKSSLFLCCVFNFPGIQQSMRFQIADACFCNLASFATFCVSKLLCSWFWLCFQCVLNFGGALRFECVLTRAFCVLRKYAAKLLRDS